MDTSATQSDPHRVRTYASAWLTLLVGLGVSLGAAWWFWREAERVDQLRFNTAVTGLLEQFDGRTEHYVMELERIADRLTGQSEVTESFWRDLVERMNPRSNYPAWLELTYATNTALPSREEIAPELQKGNGSRGQATSAGTGLPTLCVVRHWLKTRNTEWEIEEWLNSPPIQERAWFGAGGRVVSTPRLLVPGRKTNLLAAVGILVPVFTADLVELRERYQPSVPDRLRRQRLAGMLVGTLGWQAFRDSAMPSKNPDVAFEVFAGTNITAETWLKESSPTTPKVLVSDFRPRFRSSKSWPFYSRRWRFVFYSTELFDRHSSRYRSGVALGGGSVLSLLVAVLIAVQIRARLRQEMIASQLRAALCQLETARKERERLSHDLHDGTIQSLYALQLGLSRAGEQASATLPGLGARLAEYRQNLTAMIGELRGYILRHEIGQGPEGDLAGVLAALVERLRSTTGTELRVVLSNTAAPLLSGEQAVHLANLAREALSNALRHASACRITVTLRDEGGLVTLEITDDGCGFDPSRRPHTGVGLTSMASRAREAGGELQLESRAGEGTRVHVTIPVEARAS